MLKNKKVLLGVCGSIAAYKAALLIRLLVKEGAEVKVVMTASAKDFITPLTLATLSKHPVLTQFYSTEEGSWNNHVELGLWADAFVIAPATGNTLGKLANGISDNLLGACYLSARCPVWIAPAMDLDMWLHPATQKNVSLLVSYGNNLIQPGTGELASGLEGQGRMAEPEEILSVLSDYFSKNQSMREKKALVTAGPTYENIDPVRFVGNYSSGKMGLAIAMELAQRGAIVQLICGPTSLQVHHQNITRIDVVSAAEMLEECVNRAPDLDIVVMAAAVADYRPQQVANTKIKKKENVFELSLEKTTDILAGLGKAKPKNQVLVGFALETENELENATAKLKNKNLDLIVLNSMNDKGAGFGSDTNKITLIDRSGKASRFELKSKIQVAADIVDKIESIHHV